MPNVNSHKFFILQHDLLRFKDDQFLLHFQLDLILEELLTFLKVVFTVVVLSCVNLVQNIPRHLVLLGGKSHQQKLLSDVGG